MLPMINVRRVLVSCHRVDFRKSYDGLLAECYRLGTDPLAGDVILFFGRCRRRIKIMFADRTGLWVASKRFTESTVKTKFRFLVDPTVHEVSHGEMSLLLEGAAYTVERRMKERVKLLGE